MLNKLDQFKTLLSLDANYMPSEYEGEIFHYTSSSALNSILLDNKDYVKLWASRYDCLNDYSEGTVAVDVLLEVCNDLLREGIINNYLYNLFVKVKPAHTVLFLNIKENDIRPSRDKYNRFICSFSKTKDALAMWNYYSKGNKYEGFNIGFNSFSLKSSLKNEYKSKCINFHIYPVIYEREEQKKLIKKTVLKLTENYSEDQESSIRYILSNRLLEWGSIFKHECFKHEEEVRIIIDVSVKEITQEIKYRTYSGLIVPYIEVYLQKTDVFNVMFGPLQCDCFQKEQQKKIMLDMLKTKGFDLNVDYSKIPVRF